MGRPKKTAAAPALGTPLEDVEEIQSAPADDPLEEALAALGQTEQSYIVRLDRYNGRNEREYVGPMPFGADLYDDVRREFGGGRYRGRIVPTDGGGYVRHITFRIAGPAKPLGESGAATATPAAAPALDPVTAEILRTLADIRADLRERGTQRPLEDALAIVRALREVNGPPVAAERVPMSEMLETVRGLMEFRNEILDTAPPPAPSSRGGEYLQIARELGAPLLKLIARETQQEVPPVTEPERAPAVQPPPFTTMPDATHPVAKFAARLPGAARLWLARAAREDDDPDDVAQAVLENITDDKDVLELDVVIRQPEFPDVLAQVVPTLAPYPGWLRALQTALKEARGLEDATPALDVEPVAPPPDIAPNGRRGKRVPRATPAET